MFVLYIAKVSAALFPKESFVVQRFNAIGG